MLGRVKREWSAKKHFGDQSFYERLCTELPMKSQGHNEGCGAGAQAILDGWSRCQKILDGGAGAWNLGSHSTVIVCAASEFF